MTTAAAIDRVVHHSVIVELNVKSYRAQEAQSCSKSPAKVPTEGAKTNQDDKLPGT